ncbi:MAG TPA: DsbA family protein [Anaeromyxobacteraceae bacterium]|nr:DsbA family protein [Anaeromyxobacteraceae bacterium]
MPRPSSNRSQDQVTLVLYEDPLSPWCLIAEARIRAALAELPGAFELEYAPFPLRPDPRALTKTERRAFARAARRAAREPEAKGLKPDLWLSTDPPLTSVPALAALAAARLQGPARETALRKALRDAALVQGVNVTRRDVLLELAERTGLDVTKFAGALTSCEIERRVRASFEEAVDKGIDGAPALVIGDEWLVAGARSTAEYVTILRRYVGARFASSPARTLH